MVDSSPFKRFFRPTGKYLASRFGASGSIRVSPVEDSKGRLVSNPDVIIAVTNLDAKRFHREYERQVREGALVEVDARAYEDYVTKKPTGATGATSDADSTEPGEDADGPAGEDAPKKGRRRRSSTGGES